MPPKNQNPNPKRKHEDEKDEELLTPAKDSEHTAAPAAAAATDSDKGADQEQAISKKTKETKKNNDNDNKGIDDKKTGTDDDNAKQAKQRAKPLTLPTSIRPENVDSIDSRINWRDRLVFSPTDIQNDAMTACLEGLLMGHNSSTFFPFDPNLHQAPKDRADNNSNTASPSK